MTRLRLARTASLTFCVFLAAATPASAYIGAGAGFAWLSSAFVLLTTVLAVLLSVLAWALRALWRAIASPRLTGLA